MTEKGFFRGTEPGEPEYKERYRKMVLRFKDKVKGQQQQPPSGDAASAKAPPPAPSAAAEAAAAAVSAEDEDAAEAFKNEGNVKLQAKDFDGAVASYTAAIQKSPDGPKSHIYFANRAAARQYLKQHQVGHNRIEKKHAHAIVGMVCAIPCEFLLPQSFEHFVELEQKQNSPLCVCLFTLHAGACLCFFLVIVCGVSSLPTFFHGMIVCNFVWCELFLQGALDDCELSLARDPNYVKVIGIIVFLYLLFLLRFCGTVMLRLHHLCSW